MKTILEKIYKQKDGSLLYKGLPFFNPTYDPWNGHLIPLICAAETSEQFKLWEMQKQYKTHKNWNTAIELRLSDNYNEILNIKSSCHIEATIINAW